MDGTNTLELNSATMQKAVAYYLNKVVLKEDAAVEVTEVVANTKNYGTNSFTVTMVPKAKP